jgi:hypothetical protein
VRSAGVTEILDGIRRIGWGLLVILALGGLRFALRAAGWRLCMPPATRLSLKQAFAAFLAGDAVGNVTPLGLLASEPTKVFLIRHHLATREAAASLAVENLVYAASVFTMIAVGVVVLVATVPLPGAWRWGAIIALAAAAIAAIVVLRVMQGTWNTSRGARPRWRERLAALRVATLEFTAGHPSRLWRVFVLDLGFHALAIADVYLVLWWVIGGSPTLAQAVVFEALNRLITVGFKFVPFRIGVDEAASGWLAGVLALDPAVGVAQALVRKIRNLFWSAIGLAVIATHPARAGSGAGTA